MVDLAFDRAVAGALPPELRRQLALELRRMVRAAALQEGRDDLEVAVRFTTDAEIHELNRDYRAKNKPTDVLAFAQREGEGGHLHPEVLGDIVISVETAKRQAKKRGPKGLFVEVRFLAAHGLCHLLGYDHNDDEEEATMNARMADLLAEANRRGRVKAA
jgi:probable rRNA maturation factor